MNERIQSIAEQASEGLDPEEFMGASEDFLKRFAELIVAECAEIARNADLEDVDGGDSAVLRAAANQIKEHFGV